MSAEAASEPAAAVQIDGLSHRFGDHLAVDDMSFTVNEGEFFVLLGPSGCGKTTTLRIICGLEQPDAGDVFLADRRITRGKVPRAEIESRVKAAAEKLDLTAMLKLPITDLSGGEQQRVALGRAMVKDADAYLFDIQLDILRTGFAPHGLTIDTPRWMDPKVDWRRYAAALASHS